MLDRERKVIKLRFQVPKKSNEGNYVFILSYADISRFSGFSASTNRRIIIKSFRKLRHYSRAKKVIKYFQDLDNYMVEHKINYKLLYRYLRKNYTFETYLSGIIKEQSIQVHCFLKEHQLI